MVGAHCPMNWDRSRLPSMRAVSDVAIDPIATQRKRSDGSCAVRLSIARASDPSAWLPPAPGIAFLIASVIAMLALLLSITHSICPLWAPSRQYVVSGFAFPGLRTKRHAHGLRP